MINEQIIQLLMIIGQILMISVPLLVSMAMLTYFERKLIAAINLRQGPIKVGPMGLLQPFADALKLLGKETIIPSEASKLLFIISPMITFMCSLVAWAVIPFDKVHVLSNINVGILYVYAVSSLGVYGILLSGWASNSRYAFLGSIRAGAQMISYEVSIGLTIISVLLVSGSLNLSDIVNDDRPWWVTLMLVPMFVIYLVSGLAETNRCPFDLPEGESELSGGYNVEYSSMTFALFFLGEYLNMILISAMTSILFLGGWLPPFGIAALSVVPGALWFIFKICMVLFVFIWVRATMPRYRYDQLMRLGWKVFLPFTLVWLMVLAGALLYSGTLPGMK